LSWTPSTGYSAPGRRADVAIECLSSSVRFCCCFGGCWAHRVSRHAAEFGTVVPPTGKAYWSISVFHLCAGQQRLRGFEGAQQSRETQASLDAARDGVSVVGGFRLLWWVRRQWPFIECGRVKFVADWLLAISQRG
jgi:hypothetical protein